jgi:prolyl oligopeptidase
LLVCGSIVRAPEGTFGAAIAEGGVTDLLKVTGPSHDILIHSLISVSQFHKFTGGELSLVTGPMLMRLNTPSGKAWTSEYGDPVVPEDFDFIHPLSPVHNVPTNKALPATLLMINAGR